MLRFYEVREDVKNLITKGDLLQFVNPRLDKTMVDYVGPGYSDALGLGNVLCQIFVTNRKYKNTLTGQEMSYTFGVCRRGMLLC